MLTIADKVPYSELFASYLPRGAFYVVKNFQDFQFAGVLEDHLPLGKEDLDGIRERNEAGYDVFWTANAVKEEHGSSTHKEDNLAWINAVYTDLDIPFESDREEEKARLAGEIMFMECPPSFVVETRAGYHLYWFCNPLLEEFKKIQQGIYESLQHIYADPAAKNVLRLLRVPGFLQHKNGETFRAKIRMELCARNPDGTFIYYNATELQQAFPVKSAPTWGKKKVVKKVATVNSFFQNTYDVFTYVKSLPQEVVFERCNGGVLTGGEVFTLMPERGGKMQIRKDGKPTPSWIDCRVNAIFSNNVQGHYGIVEFAKWYGLELYEIADELKKLFPEYRNPSKMNK